MTNQKGSNKLVLVAIVFGIIGLTGATIQQFDGIVCKNCTFDNPGFLNFTFPPTNNASIIINESQVNNLTLDLLDKRNLSDNYFNTISTNIIQPNGTNQIKIQSYEGSADSTNTGYSITINRNNGISMCYETMIIRCYFSVKTSGAEMLNNLDMHNWNILNSPDLNNKWSKTDNINDSVDKNLSNYTNSPGFITNQTMQSDNSKLNKSAITNEFLTMPSNQQNSSVRIGTVEIQSFGINNGWVADNIYFDGSYFRHRNTGYGVMSYFGGSQDGQFVIRTSSYKAAGSIADGNSGIDRFSVERNGNVKDYQLSGSGLKNVCVNNNGEFLNSGCGVTQNITVMNNLTQQQNIEIINGVVNSVTNQSRVHIQVNNTDLGSLGLNTRLNNTVYWANNSDIRVVGFIHNNTLLTNFGYKFYIDGIMIKLDRRQNLFADDYIPFDTEIPKNSNYSIVFENPHHIEWREYVIS